MRGLFLESRSWSSDVLFMNFRDIFILLVSDPLDFSMGVA